jgi:type IV secretory pathway VirB10-like protein
MSDDKIVKLHADEDPQLEALYQQADKPVPPAHLDNIIKQAAREPQSPRRSKLTPWFAGIAASVLVGVLFIRLYPTALPPHPASYLEEEIRSEHAPATQSMARESVPQAPADSDALRDTPAKAPEAARLNQYKKSPPGELKRAAPDSSLGKAAPVSPEREKSETPASPALNAAGSSSATVEEADMALDMQTPAPESASHKAAPEAQADLEHIIELLEQGKTEDAKRAYQEFRRLYPDYIIEPATTARLENLR